MIATLLEFLFWPMFAVGASTVFYFLIRREIRNEEKMVAKMKEDFHQEVEKHIQRMKQMIGHTSRESEGPAGQIERREISV